MGTLIGEKNRNSMEYSYQVRGYLDGKPVFKCFHTGVPIPRGKGERALKAARAEAEVIGRALEKQFRADLTNSIIDHSDDTVAEYAAFYLNDI